MLALLLLFLPSLAYAVEECGRSQWNQSSLSRILGGSIVEEVTKWPWQVSVAVLRKPWLPIDSSNLASTCGGTIIDRRWVLTAAHCLSDRQLFIMARTVLTNFDTDEEFEKTEIRRVSRAIRHIDFGSVTYKTRGEFVAFNDIMVLELESPLTYGEGIAPVCLPAVGTIIPEDEYAVAIGFGEHEESSPYEGVQAHDGKLRETMLNMMPRDVCQKKLYPTKLSLSETHVCTGLHGHNVFFGDSGGPIMMKSMDGRWFEIGIASFVDIADMTKHKLSVFTKVNEFCEWIQTNTEGEVKCNDEVALKGVKIGY